MGKLKLREVKKLAQGHTAKNVLELGFIPRSSEFKGQPGLLTTQIIASLIPLPQLFIHTVGFLILPVPFQPPARTSRVLMP